MREIVFDRERLGISTEDSCVLPDDDPMYEYYRTGNMDVFNKPKQVSVIEQSEEYNKKLEMAKEMGIKPGTPAWNML